MIETFDILLICARAYLWKQIASAITSNRLRYIYRFDFHYKESYTIIRSIYPENLRFVSDVEEIAATHVRLWFAHGVERFHHRRRSVFNSWVFHVIACHEWVYKVIKLVSGRDKHALKEFIKRTRKFCSEIKQDWSLMSSKYSRNVIKSTSVNCVVNAMNWSVINVGWDHTGRNGGFCLWTWMDFIVRMVSVESQRFQCIT